MKKKYITIFIALTFVFIVPSGIPVHPAGAVHSTLNGKTFRKYRMRPYLMVASIIIMKAYPIEM
jgi:hypothetical protein